MPVTNVPSTATPNAGRVDWNNSDNSLQAEIDADKAALTAHKTSADHDGRYFTKTESDARFAAIAHNHDASYVALNGAQTINGQKKFSATGGPEAAAPAWKWWFTGELEAARIEASQYMPLMTNYLITSIRNWTGSLVEAFVIEEGAVASQAKMRIIGRDLYVRDEKVATEAYVDLRSANRIALAGQTSFIPGVGGSYCITEGGEPQVFVIPSGMRIVWLDVLGISGSDVIVFNERVQANVNQAGVLVKVTANSTTVTISIHTTNESQIMSQQFAQQVGGARYAVTLIIS